MKKLILSTAVIMLVGLTTFAQDNGSKDKKKSETKECCKPGEKCCKTGDMKCCTTTAAGKSCAKSCATASAETKKETK